MPDNPVLNPAAGLAACGYLADLHRQLAVVLAGDLTERIRATLQAVEAGSLDQARLCAHRHRGACVTIGAMELANLFYFIEDAGIRGDAAQATLYVDLLPAAAERFREAIGRL